MKRARPVRRNPPPRRRRPSARFLSWQHGLGIASVIAVLIVQFHDQWKVHEWHQVLGISDFDPPGERLKTLDDWQMRLAPGQLTVEQQQLMGGLLNELQRLKVDVELEPEVHDRYGGIWSPNQRLIRVNPRMLQSPQSLLKTLSHESIHVAQSCRPNMIDGMNSRPLGLAIDARAKQWVDQSPLYQQSPSDRQVEYEAYSYDDQPQFVIQLLQKYCQRPMVF